MRLGQSSEAGVDLRLETEFLGWWWNGVLWLKAKFSEVEG